MIDVEHFAYRVVWSAEDGEFVATVAERRFSGRFNVRVPESLHRELALSAAQEGVSLNRLISDRLARS